jgi:hypothetical protein
MGKAPNPNPKFSNKKRTQSPSDDASSINRRSNDNHSQYVTFNIESYTKTELYELKNRLVSELDQIRQLKTRIESGEFKPRLNHNGGGIEEIKVRDWGCDEGLWSDFDEAHEKQKWLDF